MAQVGGGARAGGPDAVVSWSTLLKRHPRSNVAQHTLLSVSAVILIVFYDETISPRLVSLSRVLARRYLFYGRGLPLRGTRHRVRWPESHQTARPRLVCFWLEFRIEQTEESFFLFCGRPCRCWLVTNGERWHTNPSASREWWIKAIVCFLILFHHQGCWLLNSHWDAKQIALRHRFYFKVFLRYLFLSNGSMWENIPEISFSSCLLSSSLIFPPTKPSFTKKTAVLSSRSGFCVTSPLPTQLFCCPWDRSISFEKLIQPFNFRSHPHCQLFFFLSRFSMFFYLQTHPSVGLPGQLVKAAKVASCLSFRMDDVVENQWWF